MIQTHSLNRELQEGGALFSNQVLAEGTEAKLGWWGCLGETSLPLAPGKQPGKVPYEAETCPLGQ